MEVLAEFGNASHCRNVANMGDELITRTLAFLTRMKVLHGSSSSYGNILM
jgi:hypothetical protein